MIRKKIKNRAMEESGWGSMNSLTSNNLICLIWLCEKNMKKVVCGVTIDVMLWHF